ncbi:MAG: SulP family inorganic anion transporter [Steroidobacteraceae bacterium]
MTTRAHATERFKDLFTPKLISVLREGYGRRDLTADAIAALTVAIVALPLSMAIAIACGAEPQRGLYAAIFGGFVVSALGGSRHQVGGPAGAFIVLVAGTIATHGIGGLLTATLLAGIILVSAGYLRLGTYIRYIPYPVTVGFTAGIAAIIFASQIRDLLGLKLSAPEPAALLPKLEALNAALFTFTPAAIGVSLLTILIIVGFRAWRPRWPNLLVAVVTASVLVALLGLPVDTIGTRFGGIPRTLPAPSLPIFSWPEAMSLLPVAISFALLGAIESLLSAVVADSMTGRRHRSNCELVAQGFANIASAMFGGLCVTGTIARTATNVRSGAHGPVAGMLHSVFLLAFVLFAAPLAAYVPLAALAGVLATVAWNMAEKHAFGTLLRSSHADAVVLLATFGLTVFRDLTEGIIVGFALSALLFIHRMAHSVEVEGVPVLPQEDGAADIIDSECAAQSYEAAGRDTLVYRITGAFFFGAAASVAAALDRIAERPRNFVLDFAGVRVIDSTAATTIASFARKQRARDARVFVAGASRHVRQELLAHGVREPEVHFRTDVTAAISECNSGVAGA